MIDKNSKIYIAGHCGMVGSAIERNLRKKGYCNLIIRTHNELDLTRQVDVEAFFKQEKPEYVFFAAAKVGGIKANSEQPADFIYNNLAIGLNIINSAFKFNVKKLLNLGSSCIYPKLAPQPLKEEYLLTGVLEPTNEAYAVAKIAAIKLCKYYNEQYKTDFISVMPTNLYGPGDNYDHATSHVLPAMVRKFHEARINSTEVVLWGDGSPYREFLYSEDLADACVFLMERYNQKEIGEFINVGCGKDMQILQLAELIAEITGYTGNIKWDIGKPNGTPRKLLDVSKLYNLGWVSTTDLYSGIKSVYQDFLKRYV